MRSAASQIIGSFHKSEGCHERTLNPVANCSFGNMNDFEAGPFFSLRKNSVSSPIITDIPLGPDGLGESITIKQFVRDAHQFAPTGTSFPAYAQSWAHMP